MKNALKIALILCLFSCSKRDAVQSAINASAGPCAIGGADASGNSDLLAKLLATQGCPENVLEFREKIKGLGLKIKTSMVANRGIHNPAFGSFSFFEMVEGNSSELSAGAEEGDFFFGHFTGVNNQGVVGLDHTPEAGKLMIELVVWDEAKGFFNFYEMIGQGSKGAWFYRGDSADILNDNKLLHRQANPERPVFGQNLRCSGCHTSGGPIIKELSAPHNDWWVEARKLALAPNTADQTVKAFMADLVGAEVLASAVAKGQKKMTSSQGYSAAQNDLTLQEQLRPLFCPVEINIASDLAPLNGQHDEIAIPEGFFVSPLLSKQIVNLDMTKYLVGLRVLGSKFPENLHPDADHAWLTPVKSAADLSFIKGLISQGIIDEEFASDVLAVNFTNPTTSLKRCGLLKHVPVALSSDWQNRFLQNLKSSGENSALELALNLSDAQRTTAFHQAKTDLFLEKCQQNLSSQPFVTNLMEVLAQRRAEVFASEISKNPRGQILEPGFRVIFPKIVRPSVPQKLEISPDCMIN